MERWTKHAVEWVTNLALLDKPDPTVIGYRPQKLSVSSPESADLPRDLPERHGVDSARLCEMLRALENEPRANVHSVLVIKDGCVVAEASAPGYDVHIRHLAHSMSKTVTGMAVGLLWDAGVLDLDTPLVRIFPEYVPRDRRFAKITVEHLLTMQTGVSFAEAGSVTEEHWIEAFFASPMLFEPGTSFAYNSMNSFILAKIVERVSGEGMTGFLEKRLFSVLGIKNWFWELAPDGTPKGGWGLYLSAESWAKLGILMLQGGVYGNKRVLSEEWVARATSKRAAVPEETGDFDYGYQLWVGRGTGEFLFNGMLGQNVRVDKNGGTVAVITAGNNELFQQSPALNIVRSYLGDDPIAVTSGNPRADRRELLLSEKNFFSDRAWAHPRTPIGRIRSLFGLRSRRPFLDVWDELVGNYRVRTNNVGMLPLFVRAMQNNFPGGISRIGFEKRDRRLYLTFVEGGVPYEAEVGLYGFSETVLTFGGEPYLVRILGEDVPSDGGLEFHVLLLFPELPNDRMLTFVRESDGTLRLHFSEMPNQQIAGAYLDSLGATGLRLPVVGDLLDSKQGIALVTSKISDVFVPSLALIPENAPDADERLAAEEALREEKIRSERMLIALADRFSERRDENARPGLFDGIRTLFERMMPKKEQKEPVPTEEN